MTNLSICLSASYSFYCALYYPMHLLQKRNANIGPFITDLLINRAAKTYLYKEAITLQRFV